MEEQRIYTLAECLDEYLAVRHINNKKYYSSYLIYGELILKKLLTRFNK